MQPNPKNIANIMINTVLPYCKRNKVKLENTKLTPELLVKYILIIDETN